MTVHLSERQLVLRYYGEPDGAAVDDHLAACEECRAQYAALERVLGTLEAAPVPERGEDYGARVWQRIEPRLPRRRRFPWLFAPRQWALAGAMAALMAIAFLAGRFTQKPAAPVAGAGPVRERVLLVAVGDHLERSQMVLLELVNSDSPDISYEQQTAVDLVETNRLYRQTASTSGDTATASVLDDLERVLLEIAHSPARLTEAQLRDLQKEIEKRGILFKVKVFASEVQEREKRNEL